MPTESRTSPPRLRRWGGSPELGVACSLVLLGLVVAFAAGRAGGVASNDRHIYLLGLGVLALVHVLLGSPGSLTKPGSSVALTLSALPLCYVAFQILPLPLSWLRVLSPARAELALALGPVGSSVRMAPLSVSPSATLTQFFLLAGYAVVFLLVRERTSQSSARRLPSR